MIIVIKNRQFLLKYCNEKLIMKSYHFVLTIMIAKVEYRIIIRSSLDI